MTATLEREHTGKNWHITAEVAKYRADEVEVRTERRRRPGVTGLLLPRQRAARLVVPEGVRPYEVQTRRHNLLVNAGIQRLEDLLIVAGGQGYDATHSRVGVGNSNTAASASQTDLQAAAGAGNRQFKLVGSGPTRASQTITWVATFASGEANFAWEEWCIDVGTADGTTIVTPMLNRKVTSLGTKVSGAVWQFTVTLTIS